MTPLQNTENRQIIPSSNWSNFLQFCNIWCLLALANSRHGMLGVFRLATDGMFIYVYMNQRYGLTLSKKRLATKWFQLCWSEKHQQTGHSQAEEHRSLTVIWAECFLSISGQMYAWMQSPCTKWGLESSKYDWICHIRRVLKGNILVRNRTTFCSWTLSWLVYELQQRSEKRKISQTGLGTINQFPHQLANAKTHQKPVPQL